MKKKVGIITYHRAINYGAILQTFALQTILKEIGVECKVLDYRNEKLEEIHKKRTLTDCKSFKSFIMFLILPNLYNLKYDKFREFSDKYLELSSKIDTSENFAIHENEYDFFITGSDQVWNYKINDGDSVYFLNFVKEKLKKKTYAASFGLSTIPDEYKPIYKELLSDFDSILVREKQGARIIDDLLLKKAFIVLDPTMLLSKKQWIDKFELYKKEFFTNEKYILVYAFSGSTHIKELAINISNKTGYKIFWIKSTYRKNPRIKYIKLAGPKEFICLFNNAEYIITNSFHGTVFSIVFNKQFFTELLPKNTGVNSRLENILDMFDLNDRRVVSTNPDIIDSRIDYDSVDLKLEEERKSQLYY